jgi:hypothetical protein
MLVDRVVLYPRRLEVMGILPTQAPPTIRMDRKAL